MTNPTRKPGDPGHPVDLMDALHDRVHAEECLHPNPRWGPRRERVTKTKRVRRVRIAVAVDSSGQFVATDMPDNDTDPRVTLDRLSLLEEVGPEARCQIAEIDAWLPEEPAVVRGEVVDV